MKVLFAHDHKFRKIEGDYYSIGGLSNDVLSRYVNNFGTVNVIARVIPKQVTDRNLSQITNKKVSIFDSKDKSYSIKRLVSESDIVIARLPSALGMRAIWYAEKSKKPYFIEMVGDPWTSLWYYGNLKGKIAAPIITILNKILVKRSKYVIYVSRRFLQDRYPTKGYSVGCSDAVLDMPQKEILEKRIQKINMDENIILGLIGSLAVDYRGHGTVIKAVSELKKRGINCKVHFLGGGSKEKWEKVANEYGVTESVEYCGTLPSGEPVLEWIDNVDILTMPTLQETLGRAIIEAMSRGCPVIGSIETAIGEQIGSDCLCKAKDYISLANMVERMIKDRDYMKYCAQENFYRSFKYTNDQTDRIRNAFFEYFLSSINGYQRAVEK